MEFTVRLCDVDRDQAALVGGKAANLGEMTGLAGIVVPRGLCVTTHAYAALVTGSPEICAALDELDAVSLGEDQTKAALGTKMRSLIEQVSLPNDLTASIAAFLAEGGERAAWAVRSSATAEDMPTASFAGQHESYLNLTGIDAIVDAIRRCWASLFAERAVTYRERIGISHRSTNMAVIVQQAVLADVSGVMFTADPATGDRTVVAIEAAAGTGEALVSGAVVPEAFKLRNGQVIEAPKSDQPILSDEQVHALAAIGRRLTAHFGCPQDIEWCLLDGRFQIVQSRSITTVFPIPPRDDDRHYVYLSVGHQQMMTDAMRPLGLSVWQMHAARPMHEAGGRLFVDVTDQLASPASRKALLQMLNRDPLISNVINMLLERGFVETHPDETNDQTSASAHEPQANNSASANAPDPSHVADLIAESENSVAALRRNLGAKSGDALLEVIADDIAAQRQQLTNPKSMQVLMTGIEALWWLNDHLLEWLGERGIADTLSQSVDQNITAQMGLDLLDVADAIRPYEAAISFLRQLDANTSIADLTKVDGGREALEAINVYLDKYGMRGTGEIDITRTRWREQPGIIVPMILANIDQFAPGEATRRFQAGLTRAKAAEQDVLKRLRALPDGDAKAEETKAAIDRLRAFAGYREFPKYDWVRHLDLYKQAITEEAERLVGRDVIDRPEDIFYLRFDELRDLVKSQQADRDLIAARRAEFAGQERLASPRVLTSDGAALSGSFERAELPANAIPGLAVSSGCVEGRARVITDVVAAEMEPGDILVTNYTDPSWTPVFMTIAGLVTEAGGQMSHGAVIAREYGLPAIVAVKDATRRITDGLHIRVDGTAGVITILPTE